MAARAWAGVHTGDVASEHVLIGRGGHGGVADVHLSGFGIAQLNRDTAAVSADISAFGGLLLETLTGSAPDHRELEAARDRP